MEGMTKSELSKVLPEPFNHIVLLGDIDYKSSGGDHAFVKKLGYVPKMGGDCSYSAEGLPWFSLSSYGDWGTMFGRTTDVGRRIFHDMWKEGVIELWRGNWYDCNGNQYVYDGGYRMYDRKEKRWKDIENPFNQK